jgi:hypothetical protein
MHLAGDSELVRELENFFDSSSITHREIVSCEQCGSRMQNYDFEFWLFGTEKTWTVKIPLCSTCGRAIVPQSLGIH